MNIITAQVSNTVSNIAGNITGLAKSYFESLFPKDYFKKVFIVGSQSSSEMSSFLEDDVQIKELPILSINPNTILGFNDTSMGVLPKWRRGQRDIFKYNPYKGRDYGYHPIFINDYDRISIYTIPHRFKVIIDYRIEVATHMQKLDIIHILRSKFEADEKYFLNNLKMEAEIPKSIIKAISNIKEYDMTNNDDVIDYLNYLQRFSEGYISRKRNLSTGNEAFNFLYTGNILLSVENPATGDGQNSERDNMTQGKNYIDFSLGYELWVPGSYVLETKELKKDDYNVYNDEYTMVDYTIQTRPPKARGDRYQIGWSKFITNDNELIDTIDFSVLLKSNHLAYINKLKAEKNYDLLNEIFEVMIFKDNQELEKDKDFEIQWIGDANQVKLKNLLLNYTYSLGIYADMKILNEELLLLDKKPGKGRL